ncbi:hypothetical protein MUN88_00965 [Gracilibacillus caseinilyticus]|uniref:Uncharacterized protein n=1 Tax=Gracilibacillus caseinilyticus TaxID=2932256 RepID=A0ABY4EWY3_9BACI|nr:hypothetical protein [Gracilibacillus caseinilyticus]UOQ48763.1 hypothetical protein MUN88_00965 [Gracilibacillus caseinilyticus]
MKNFKCSHDSYKMEADHSADPLWCSMCGFNLEINDFPLSQRLKTDLMEWIVEYGDILEQSDWGEKITDDTAILIKSHNEKGIRLHQKLKEELGDGYKVSYVHTSL